MAKILVVEDSPTQAAKLEICLLEQGFEPIVAADAEIALDLLAKDRFDLIVSDIVMPGLSGYELCRKVKASRDWRDTPVILLTSRHDPMDIIQGLEAGADNFFTKPYEPDKLIKRINSVLDGRRDIAEGKLRVGFEVSFLGKRVTITSERQQILDLLISSFEDIVEANQTLERTKQEIARARDAAEEAARAKANFLAAMSHEIRTPMNGIVGMVDLLAESELTADQRMMISTVKTSAYSLLGIIGDILDFSKLEAGRMSLEQVPISINELFESVGMAFWQMIREKSLRLHMFCDPRIPSHVLGDQVRLRQILSNLIGNAIKFTKTTPEQVGKIVVRAELVSSNADQVQIRFSVSDNGIGMDREVQSRLFRPFEQADASTVRQYGGTGLGLSICKQLATLMGGAIHLESEPGVGSVFSVDLGFGGAQEKRRTTDLGGIRVLHLVDPKSSEVAEFLSRYVTHWNAKADVVFDSGECIKRLAEAAGTPDRFHIVVFGPSVAPDDQINIREKILLNPALRTLRFVFVANDHQRAAKMMSSNTLSMTAAPLSYWGYMESIAIASGRASPETKVLVEKEVLPKIQPPTIDEAAAMGQLILVAEDNEVNQDVIRRQLTRLGYATVIVADGLQALEAHATGRYSLLLTDCHMPQMDGYQLTTKIRERERQTGQHIPIIAITANALHGEVERCLAIGMDDFVVKPIELRAFRTKLRQWMPQRAKDGGPASDAGDTQAQSLAS